MANWTLTTRTSANASNHNNGPQSLPPKRPPDGHKAKARSTPSAGQRTYSLHPNPVRLLCRASGRLVPVLAPVAQAAGPAPVVETMAHPSTDTKTMIPDLHITLSVPPQVVRNLAKVNDAATRSRRCGHRGRRRRALHHSRQAHRLWDKWSQRVQVAPVEAFARPIPPHTEPTYD